jgi:hypothetical protein
MVWQLPAIAIFVVPCTGLDCTARNLRRPRVNSYLHSQLTSERSRPCLYGPTTAQGVRGPSRLGAVESVRAHAAMMGASLSDTVQLTMELQPRNMRLGSRVSNMRREYCEN